MLSNLDVKLNGNTEVRLEILKPQDDLTNYASWFQNRSEVEYIEYSQNNSVITENELREYVATHFNSDDALLFGIYLADNHVGNIKFDNFHDDKSCILGVMIGAKEARGKGVFKQVFHLTSDYLAKEHNIKRIILYVEEGNTPAIKAYEKSGFVLDGNKGSKHIMYFDL